MNTELRKNAKHDLSKKNLKLINNAVFGKTTENVRKLREYQIETIRNYAVSEPNNHTSNFFHIIY